jgi:hypothetical protein
MPKAPIATASARPVTPNGRDLVRIGLGPWGVRGSSQPYDLMNANVVAHAVASAATFGEGKYICGPAPG